MVWIDQIGELSKFMPMDLLVLYLRNNATILSLLVRKRSSDITMLELISQGAERVLQLVFQV